MTFYDTIDKILSTNNLNIDLMLEPINVIVFFGNVNHINSKIESNKKIDDIFKDEIPHPRALSLTWIDEDGIITSASIDSLSMFRLSKNDEIQKDYLNNYQDAGIINSTYHIYLGKALEYELELDLNGYLCKFYYDELGEQKYIEDEIVIPDFKEIKYQKLYKYDNENDFINAVMLEFLFRNIQHNKILDKYEDEGDEVRYTIKTDKDLQELYGINLDTFHSLEPMMNLLFSKELSTNGIYSLLKTLPSPLITIKLDLEQPLEELIKKITTLKENYENELNASLNLKEVLNENYQKSINEILNNFSKIFKKKQDDLIKALYILDYVNARDAQIDIYNRKYEGNDKYPTKRLDENSVFKEDNINPNC